MLELEHATARGSYASHDVSERLSADRGVDRRPIDRYVDPGRSRDDEPLVPGGRALWEVDDDLIPDRDRNGAVMVRARKGVPAHRVPSLSPISAAASRIRVRRERRGRGGGSGGLAKRRWEPAGCERDVGLERHGTASWRGEIAELRSLCASD